MKIKEKLQLGAFLLMLTGALAAAEKKNIPYYDPGFPQSGNREYLKERCVLDLSTPDGVKDFPTLVWFHEETNTIRPESTGTRLRSPLSITVFPAKARSVRIIFMMRLLPSHGSSNILKSTAEIRIWSIFPVIPPADI